MVGETRIKTKQTTHKTCALGLDWIGLDYVTTISGCVNIVCVCAIMHCLLSRVLSLSPSLVRTNIWLPLSVHGCPGPCIKYTQAHT